MSPKSRGRPAGRGRKGKNKPRAAVREFRLSDRVLRDARRIVGDVRGLEVERWASEWFGHAWLAAAMGEREPEHQLCMEVVGRASSKPSAHGLAAVAALRRVAPERDEKMLAGTVEILTESQPSPPWIDAALPEPVGAWRAVNVWDSERMLFVEYAEPEPHTLMVQIDIAAAGFIDTLLMLGQDGANGWEQLRDPDDVPMPLEERPAGEVLAQMADAMRQTDMMFPRQADEGYVALRSLTWSRCRAHLPAIGDWEPPPELDREPIIEEFIASGASGDETTRSLAELFLNYGEGYMTAGPLCWSPDQVELFLVDWLPRKAVLDADDRAALPETLAAWVRFALQRRGIADRWIEPVVAAVDEHKEAFAEAFEDETGWGPAKEIAAELVGRGVDMSDRELVDDAVRALNAERLARRLSEGDREL